MRLAGVEVGSDEQTGVLQKDLMSQEERVEKMTEGGDL